MSRDHSHPGLSPLGKEGPVLRTREALPHCATCPGARVLVSVAPGLLVKSSPACPGDIPGTEEGPSGLAVPQAGEPTGPGCPPTLDAPPRLLASRPAPGAWGGRRSRRLVGASHSGRGAATPQIRGSLTLRTWLCWGCASSQGRVSGGSSRGRPASSAWHTWGRSVGSRVPRRLPPEASRRQQLVSQTRQPLEGVGAGRACVPARACPPRHLSTKP